MENGSKLTAKNDHFEIFVNFRHFQRIFFEIGKFRLKKFRKAPDNKTRSEARCLIYGRKFPQDDPRIGITVNFQVLLRRTFF